MPKCNVCVRGSLGRSECREDSYEYRYRVFVSRYVSKEMGWVCPRMAPQDHLDCF